MADCDLETTSIERFNHRLFRLPLCVLEQQPREQHSTLVRLQSSTLSHRTDLRRGTFELDRKSKELRLPHRSTSNSRRKVQSPHQSQTPMSRLHPISLLAHRL
jgi:hypothetical protein